MTTLGPLALGGVPRIAAPLTDRTPPDLVEAARKEGLDAVEARIDQFGSLAPDALVTSLTGFRPLPILATIRSAAEGGSWAGSESERLALYRWVVPHVDGIDVEIAAAEIVEAAVAAAREHGRTVILSHHDFEATPPAAALRAHIERGRALGADIVKLAARVRGDDDLRTLADVLVREPAGSLIVIGMGDAGVVTRAAFPLLGSALTYASLDASTAPGQLEFSRMLDLLRTLSPAFAAEKSG